MKEKEDSNNWFSKWEEDLPSPEELMPLSQSLITPDLALAFDITNALTSNPSPNTGHRGLHRPSDLSNPLPPPGTGIHQPTSGDFVADSGGGGADEPARTLKRPRLVWTPQLHKRFVDAVAHLGIKNAVPKTIMQLMSVDGLTRENVASHLQKYRLYLKRMQGLSGGGGGGGSAAASSDPATDHLFASSPVPAHFLHPGRSNSEHYMPFVPVAALQHQHQMAAAPHPQQIQIPYHRPVGQFGSPPNGQFEQPFLSRPSNPVHRVGAPIHTPVQPYGQDLETANANGGGRKVLTLFPTGDD